MKLLISTCAVLSILGQEANGDQEIKSPWCTTNSPVENGHTATITCHFAFNIEHSNYDYSVERYTENSDSNSRPVLLLDCFYEPSEGKRQPCKPTDDDYTLTGLSGSELTLTIAETTTKHAGTYVCKTTAPSQKGLQHCYLNVSKTEVPTSMHPACQSMDTSKYYEATIVLGCVLGIVVVANAGAVYWIFRKQKDGRRKTSTKGLDTRQEQDSMLSPEDGIYPGSRHNQHLDLAEDPSTRRVLMQTEQPRYNLRPRRHRLMEQADHWQVSTLLRFLRHADENINRHEMPNCTHVGLRRRDMCSNCFNTRVTWTVGPSHIPSSSEGGEM